MSANSITAGEAGEVADELTSTCRLCPPDGGTVVARFPGEAPGWRAGQRAREETERTGVPHHDHYDPQLDAFLVVRHGGGLLPRQAGPLDDRLAVPAPATGAVEPEPAAAAAPGTAAAQ